VQRPSWVDSGLYPFEDHWLDGIHYVDEGDGPPLLMLHGNPTWSFTWRGVIQGLRDRYRCIAPDLPGFGLSASPPGYQWTPQEHAAAIGRFVDELDLRDATLMVQDWGGPIGFAVAGRQPQRFSAYVIGNTWAWSMKGSLAARAFSGFLGGPIGRRLILKRNFFVETIIPRASRQKLTERVMDQYRGPFPTAESRRPVAAFPKQIIAATPWLEQVEARIPRRPALIVWPTDDQAFGDGARRKWESLMPDHRTVVLEGAKHYIGEDAPDEIVRAVCDWAAKTGQPASHA
jgi:haloalkane dehalogenase